MEKPGRNAPCPCGSGLKYKRCCEDKDRADAIKEELGTLNAHEEAEMLVFDLVYQSILNAVWISFHRHAAVMPQIEEMEQFYLEVYGYELDLSLVEEAVLPLPLQAREKLIAIHGFRDEKIVDIPPKEDSKEANP